MTEDIKRAAEAIAEADGILIGAGAGMGVDSGLPDFRGNEGFWRAYPPFRGKSFSEIANPRWFRDNPALAWGFYGHRLNLYRQTVPHNGFAVLSELCRDKGWFVYTSNVDGQFQKAGFDQTQIMECHGSIHHLQCTNNACYSREPRIWSADNTHVAVDEETFMAQEALPCCPACGSVARPNILMFGDSGWLEDRALEQQRRFQDWQKSLDGKLVVIECGAGTAIPSVRLECQDFMKDYGATLIRINPREPEGPTGTISISCGANEALQLIQSFGIL